MTRFLVPTLLAFVLAGCAAPEAPARTPTGPTPTASPVDTAAPPSVSGAPVTSGPESPPSDSTDVFLEGCLPPSVTAMDVEVEVTGRTEDAGGDLVLLEWFDPGADPIRLATDFHPVVLRIDGEMCQSVLREQTDAFDLRAHMSDASVAALMRQNSEWKASKVGGVGAYERVLKGAYGDPLVLCPDGGSTNGACLDQARGQALRSLGIAVSDPVR